MFSNIYFLFFIFLTMQHTVALVLDVNESLLIAGTQPSLDSIRKMTCSVYLYPVISASLNYNSITLQLLYEINIDPQYYWSNIIRVGFLSYIIGSMKLGFCNLISKVPCCQNFEQSWLWHTDTVSSFVYQYQRSIFKPCSPQTGIWKLRLMVDGSWVECAPGSRYCSLFYQMAY